MNDHLKGLFITTLGVLFIVPDALFVRLIDAEALTIAFWRALSCGLVTTLWLTVRDFGWWRQMRGLGLRGLIYAISVGGCGALFVVAVSLTSVANVVFILAATPVFAAFLSFLLLGERLSPRTLTTIVAAMVGVGIIAYGSGETEGASFAGDAVAVLIAALFAIGLTAARSLRPVSVLPILPLGQFGAAAILWVFAPVTEISGTGLGLAFLHGGLFIAGSTALLAMGPRWLPSSEVALLMLLESVLSPLLVWAVVGEFPGQWALIGGAVVIGALALSNAVALLRGRRGTGSARP